MPSGCGSGWRSAWAASAVPWGLRSADGGKILSDFTIQRFNAFGEELLFRGVIFALLLSLPVRRAIVLNGLVVAVRGSAPAVAR